MITIDISEETETHQQMIDVLERVLELAKEGYHSGVYPNWSLEGEEEFND